MINIGLIRGRGITIYLNVGGGLTPGRTVSVVEILLHAGE